MRKFDKIYEDYMKEGNQTFPGGSGTNEPSTPSSTGSVGSSGGGVYPGQEQEREASIYSADEGGNNISPLANFREVENFLTNVGVENSKESQAMVDFLQTDKGNAFIQYLASLGSKQGATQGVNQGATQ